MPPEEKPDRAKIYCDWAKEKLQTAGAVQIERIRLKGFRRTQQRRKTGLASGTREIRRLERPEAVFSGVLQVTDPQGFNRLLAHGIGRHRAFGCSMLLIRPQER